MEIKQEKKGEVVIIGLVGRLDANTAGQLEKKILPLIDEGEKKLLIDFSELEYISSAGLRLLLLTAKKLKNIKGKIVLCSMKEYIKEIFEIAGFTPIFTIRENQDEAVKEFE